MGTILLVCCVCSLFATPGSVLHQAPVTMRFSRQEHWSGLPFPSPGESSWPGDKLMSLVPPALSGRFFTCSATWEALSYITWMPSKDGIPLYIATYRICNSLICCWCEGKMLPLLWKTSRVLQKVKARVAIWLRSSTPKYNPKRTENIHLHKTCTCIFTVVLFITAKKYNQPKCTSTDE